MTLATKFRFLLSFLFVVSMATAQDEIDEDDIIDPEDTLRVYNMNNYRPRLLTISGGFVTTIPTGDNFVANGMRSNGGFNIRAQINVYKQIFLAGTYEHNFFEITEPLLIGNYVRTSVASEYASIGYEFLPFKNFRLGVSIGLGNTDHHNVSYTNGNKAKQRDSGSFSTYGFYIDYEITYCFAFYFNYEFRSSKMNIKAPSQFQNFFGNTKFHNLGIGVKFYIDDTNLFQ